MSHLLAALFSQDSIPLWTALGAIVGGASALAAAWSASAAAKSARISEEMWRGQSDPKVIVYTRPDPERQTILLIRIENIGKDIARDVTFSASRPIPSAAFGVTPDVEPPSGTMLAGPLMTGIPAFGPGDYREITWGQFWGLKAALGNEPLVLDYSYSFDGRRFTGQAVLEIESYHETNNATRAVETIARGIDRSANALERIASSSGQIAHTSSEALAQLRPQERNGGD